MIYYNTKKKEKINKYIFQTKATQKLRLLCMCVCVCVNGFDANKSDRTIKIMFRHKIRVELVACLPFIVNLLSECEIKKRKKKPET